MNNIIRFELRRNLKSSIIWTIALCGLIALFSTYFPIIKDSGQEMIAMLDQMPKQFLQAFGLDDVTRIFELSGFYGVYGLYVAMIYVVYASMLGLNLFSYSKTKKIDEYLLVKPVSRSKLFIARLVTGIGFLLVIWSIFSVAGYFSLTMITGDSLNVTDYMNGNINMLILGLITYSISILVAVLMPKVKIAISIALPIVFIQYGIDLLIKMLDKTDYSIISPFSTFALSEGIANGLDWLAIAIYGLVIVSLILFSLIWFVRQESK